MKKRALLSVYDKTGICDFAKKLEDNGFEIVATSETLEEIHNVCSGPLHISEVTGYNELLGGKVRLAHPAVYAGIIARRSDIEQMNEIITGGYEPIDIVAINVPDFEYDTDADSVETAASINAGDLAVLRTAVKNYSDVAVIIDPADYPLVIDEILEQGEVKAQTKLMLAYKVLEFTSHYDSKAAAAFREKAGIIGYPEKLSFPYVKAFDFKYGENAQQTAAFYTDCVPVKGTLSDTEYLKGSVSTYTGMLNVGNAVEIIKEFDIPAAIVVQNGVPCAGGTGDTVCDAFTRAYRANTSCVTGSAVALNREVDRKTALELAKFVITAVLAPSYDEQALEVLEKKEELCLIRLNNPDARQTSKIPDIRKISGGILVQSPDTRLYNQNELQCVTSAVPDEEQSRDLMFAWRVAKYAKSNAAVAVSDSRITGICQCITDADEAVRIAAGYADEQGGVIACDAPISDPDTISLLSRSGIKALIQPGGTANDEAITDICNENNIAMLLTNATHTKN